MSDVDETLRDAGDRWRSQQPPARVTGERGPGAPVRGASKGRARRPVIVAAIAATLAVAVGAGVFALRSGGGRERTVTATGGGPGLLSFSKDQLAAMLFPASHADFAESQKLLGFQSAVANASTSDCLVEHGAQPLPNRHEVVVLSSEMRFQYFEDPAALRRVGFTSIGGEPPAGSSSPEEEPYVTPPSEAMAACAALPNAAAPLDEAISLFGGWNEELGVLEAEAEIAAAWDAWLGCIRDRGYEVTSEDDFVSQLYTSVRAEALAPETLRAIDLKYSTDYADCLEQFVVPARTSARMTARADFLAEHQAAFDRQLQELAPAIEDLAAKYDIRNLDQLWPISIEPAPPNTAPNDPIDAGPEIKLRRVDVPTFVRTTLETEMLIPGTEPIALKPDHRSSITISRQEDRQSGAPVRCISKQQPTAELASSSVSSTCDSGRYDEIPTQMLQTFYYPHPESNADAVVYYVWTETPPGTSYVTFDGPGLRAWQRPTDGIAVFPVDGGPTDAVVRAYDAAGTAILEIAVTSRIDGSRTEVPETNQGIVVNQPPWYDLDATVRWCRSAPLDELRTTLGFPGSADTFLAADRATGTSVSVKIRDYCEQTARLAPNPAGDIFVTFGFANGRAVAEYYERVDTFENGTQITTNGAPIPQDQALARIAEQRRTVGDLCDRRPNPEAPDPICNP